MENGEGEWLSTLDDFRLRLIRDCFKFHGREDRPILGETEFRKLFALDMQANGLADIESQFIQGGSLRDHGKVEALSHKLAFAFGNAHLDRSLHQWLASDSSMHQHCSVRKFDPNLTLFATASSSRAPPPRASADKTPGPPPSGSWWQK